MRLWEIWLCKNVESVKNERGNKNIIKFNFKSVFPLEREISI